MAFLRILCLVLAATNCTLVQAQTEDDCSNAISHDVYLEEAVQAINKAKLSIPKCGQPPSDFKPMDCAEVWQAGHRSSGVYQVWPRSRVSSDRPMPLDVYCDMDTDGGGWMVIQRRGNYSRPSDYFNKDWESYKRGFGNIEEDFWLGNDAIHALSTQRQVSARFELQDVEGEETYAEYESFWIDDERDLYRLHVADYSGDAGDSLASYHNHEMFSTKDQDNDSWNSGSCAQRHTGGWWFNSCHESNLNGIYQPGRSKATQPVGVVWKGFKTLQESLQASEIKLRPKYFKSSSFKRENSCGRLN